MIDPENKRKIITVREKYGWTEEVLRDLAELAAVEDYWKNVQEFLITVLGEEWSELSIRNEQLVQRARRELDERVREKIEKSEAGIRSYSA